MAFMGIPFDSRLVEGDDGSFYEDRTVFSADIAHYFGYLSTDGICLDLGETLGNQLKVEAGTGSNVILNPGTIKIQGRMGWITEAETIQATAGSSQPRYDTAVIELNLNIAVRGFTFKLIQGTPAASPAPPTLTRNENVWQLGLANIYRAANSISLGTITDTREDEDRCGISSINAPLDFEKNMYVLLPSARIQSGDDLNDYTDYGCWLCASKATTATLSNCPFTGGGFSLRVLAGNRSYKTQEIIRWDGKRYYRSLHNDTWDEWRTMLTDKDIIPVTNGGTGAITAAAALANLGVESHIVESGGTTEHTTGYIKYSNGVMIQWGSNTISASAGNASGAIVFSEPFFNTNYRIVITESRNGSVVTGVAECNTAGNVTRTTSNTVVLAKKSPGTGNLEIGCSWIAIGLWKELEV